MIRRPLAFRDDVLARPVRADPGDPRALALRPSRLRAVRRDHAAAVLLSDAHRDRDFSTTSWPRSPRACPQASAVVEFGAGSATKTPILLEAIAPAAYVPVDISGDYLEQSAAELAAALSRGSKSSRSSPISRGRSRLPGGIDHLPKLGFFPGSTIGNFVPRSATDLLRQFRDLLGAGSQLLIGMDRVKPVERLIAAYDDPEGVTAQFTLNLLTPHQPRARRRHSRSMPSATKRAGTTYCRASRSTSSPRATSTSASPGSASHFAQGSSIHAENSHKYGPRGGRVLLLAGGWTPVAEWTDPAGDFAIVLAEAEPERFAP